MTTEGQATRERLEADIATAQDQILAFNAHWLNHKHLTSAVGAAVMAFIFTGMLVPPAEIVMWVLCGALVAAFAGVLVWRGKKADALNEQMATAQKAFKEYERGRRKKK
ncbi:hypothetical protein [Pseudodesulfovibrio sp. zrk46]|uniref:hypothetical protein n=1 Tax=Pseudodesulfovibrio sp. zrk46 TaxID=2725288 RepID=UPI0014490352|nr:hypothetical protein [Pseudodesulfovibrio sp. zrk46]QJB55117.1 hypothetical protein HFN16_01285 [Pseudodesulfovibrio sp. zrk46]